MVKDYWFETIRWRHPAMQEVKHWKQIARPTARSQGQMFMPCISLVNSPRGISFAFKLNPSFTLYGRVEKSSYSPGLGVVVIHLPFAFHDEKLEIIKTRVRIFSGHLSARLPFGGYHGMMRHVDCKTQSRLGFDVLSVN